MLDSYINLTNIQKVLKSVQTENKEEIINVENIIFKDVDSFVTKMKNYLTEKLNLNYNYYLVKDFNGNFSHILAREESNIFKNYIEGKDVLDFEIEELIDSRKFNNENEIIILDINFNDKYLNMGYICKSFDYYFLSYSDSFKKILEAFIDYQLSINETYLD